MPLTADQLLNQAFGADHVNTKKGERLFEREKLNPYTAYELVQTKNKTGAWVVNVAFEGNGGIEKSSKSFPNFMEAQDHINSLKTKKVKHGKR